MRCFPDHQMHSLPAKAHGQDQPAWEKEYRGALLDTAVARVKLPIDAKQWQIFDLCALQAWPVRDVRKALSVSAGRVYLGKHRIASAIAKEVKRLEKEFEKTALVAAKSDTVKSECILNP